MTAADSGLQLDLTALIPEGAYNGVDQAEENTEPNWRDWAFNVIQELARTGREFTNDDVRLRGVDEPPHPNHWGALFTAARRKGLIEPTGQVRPSTTPSRNASLNRVWRGVERKGAA